MTTDDDEAVNDGDQDDGPLSMRSAEIAEVLGSMPSLGDLHDQLDPTAAEARRLEHRPNVDHLPSAVVAGLPAFGSGDRIVVERRARCVPGTPWLDTRLLLVTSIDREKRVVRCTDPSVHHVCFVGYDDPFTRVLLPPKKGSPFRAPKDVHECTSPTREVTSFFDGETTIHDPRASREGHGGLATATAEARRRGRPRGTAP